MRNDKIMYTQMIIKLTKKICFKHKPMKFKESENLNERQFLLTIQNKGRITIKDIKYALSHYFYSCMYAIKF